MRKQIFATATMRRPRFKTQAEAEAAYEANKQFDAARSNHDIIVKLALRIARAERFAKEARSTARTWRTMGTSPTLADEYEYQASRCDSDVCQLCVEMQRACRGEVGPFPSDSWSHLNEG